MSPIFIKDFTWRQTQNDVFITVRVPGVTLANSDLLVSDKYIKINCRPYIWEIFLRDEINSSKSTAKIYVNNSTAVFHLPKKISGIVWAAVEQEKTFESSNSLVECRLNEISKMNELTIQNIKSLHEFRSDQQKKCRENHQKNVNEAREKARRQLEIDKLETLNSSQVDQDEINDKIINSVEIPIRSFSKIQVQFTPKSIQN